MSTDTASAIAVALSSGLAATSLRAWVSSRPRRSRAAGGLGPAHVEGHSARSSPRASRTGRAPGWRRTGGRSDLNHRRAPSRVGVPIS